MDASLEPHEKSLYAGWIHSPTVASRDPVETVLAFKIGRLLNFPGSRVLKAFREVPGLDPELLRKVEAFVAEEANLEFVKDGESRRIRMREDETA
jgi:hypothetical protein